MTARCGAALAVAPKLDNVRVAREFVDRRCHEAGVCDDLCDTAVLLTSELVTNAFLHGRSEVRMQLVIEPRQVTVLVGDDNSRHPRPVSLDDEALDGRGLSIVERAANHWGVHDEKVGKTVWFSLDRT